MADIVEGQVSLAVISTQLAVQNNKLDNIMTLMETEKDWREKHELRISELEKGSIIQKERMSVSSWVDRALIIIGSAIAAFIGTR